MIELIEITKRFGPKVAVDRLSLEVSRGELVAFLGRNGAGKTTTIKIICGLLSPTSGTVRIAGHDVTRNGQDARHLLGYVPDQPYLYEKLTGREFLQFVIDMYALSPVSAGKRLRELIDLFEMGSYIDCLTEGYSHGMRQRVVFAAALLRDPEVLVVDEPMVGLDPKSARLVKDLLRARAQSGAAVFMSTHTLDVAEQVADRIAIVDHGRLVSCGSLPELRASMRMHGPLEELFLRITDQIDERHVSEAGNAVGRRQGVAGNGAEGML
jgi:ABC-2 type transport system ATP-binding protein